MLLNVLSQFYSLKVFRTRWSDDCERKYGNRNNGWIDKLNKINIYVLIKLYCFKDNVNGTVSTDAQDNNCLDNNNRDGRFFSLLISFSILWYKNEYYWYIIISDSVLSRYSQNYNIYFESSKVSLKFGSYIRCFFA